MSGLFFLAFGGLEFEISPQSPPCARALIAGNPRATVFYCAISSFFSTLLLKATPKQPKQQCEIIPQWGFALPRKQLRHQPTRSRTYAHPRTLPRPGAHESTRSDHCPGGLLPQSCPADTEGLGQRRDRADQAPKREWPTGLARVQTARGLGSCCVTSLPPPPPWHVAERRAGATQLHHLVARLGRTPASLTLYRHGDGLRSLAAAEAIGVPLRQTAIILAVARTYEGAWPAQPPVRWWRDVLPSL